MIYLITGVPGSGKTLYAVSTLVQSLSKQENYKNGVLVKRRVVIDGIPDLVIPHETMGKIVEDDKGNLSSDEDSLLTWDKWCQPGDVLVVDEVQRYWRPRGMGSKIPAEIKALETHRHKGVDFVIITQNPMLLDQNVRRLIGRHQHIRRLFGMSRALIYDWDGCSVDVHRVKTATKTFWTYPKKAYELYKSSELHTKQKQKFPIWLLLPIFALIGGAFVAPKAWSVMSSSMSGKGISSQASPVAPQAQTVTVPIPPLESSQSKNKIAEFDASLVPKNPKLELQEKEDIEPVGCIASAASVCKCFDSKARSVPVVKSMCPDMTVKKFTPEINASILAETPLPKYESPEDLASYSILKNNRIRD